MIANWLRRVSKWGVLATLMALALIVGVDGWLSRSLPDLRPWHEGERLPDFSWRDASDFDARTQDTLT